MLLAGKKPHFYVYVSSKLIKTDEKVPVRFMSRF